MSLVLNSAPRVLPDAMGEIHFGRYTGQCMSIDWSLLNPTYGRSRLWRFFHHKRWQYVALASPEYFCGVAIVHVGWTSAAFAYVFDRRVKKEVCAWSQDGIPFFTTKIGNVPFSEAYFNHCDKHILFESYPAGYRLDVVSKKFEIHAEIDSQNAAPLLLATGPIKEGGVHATQKSPGMPAKGVFKIDGQERILQDLTASFDYSNGLLARKTQWRWASAHTTELGFNLQQGYFGQNENVLWLDNKLISLGAAQIQYNPASYMQPWKISTDDGLLDLIFTPEGSRHENRQLGIASSRYVQPIGMFSGWVRAALDESKYLIEGLLGVTEDHYARW